MPLKNILFFFFVFTSIIEGQVSFAQKLELKDITKMELITAGSWMDGYYRKVEVIPENGIWKSYQTRLASNGNSRGRQIANDSTRTFIQDIPASTVTQFIKLATTPYPLIKDELFNIKTAELIVQIDSNIAVEERYNRRKISPSPEWKNQFINAVNSKSIVSNTLYNILHPMLMSDRSHYYIIITDRFSKTDTINADAYNELYYLPWRIKGRESYNPNITKLFELIGGNIIYEEKEQKRLNSQIISELYYNHTFKAKLDWDRFKADQPELYSQASKTLIPLKFSRYNEGPSTYDMGYTGVFLSTRLPGYMQLDCSFAKAYSNLIGFGNAVEGRLAVWYKKGSFLFAFMKRHPNATMYFSPSIGEELYTEIRKRYPDIAKFERPEVKVFSIYGDRGFNSSSLWMLLPDDRLILIRYGGKLADNYQTKFDVIPAKRYQSSSSNVCIVFDKYGKKIGGSEEPFEVKKPEL